MEDGEPSMRNSIVLCAQTSKSLSWRVYMSPLTRDMQNVVTCDGEFPEAFGRIRPGKEHFGKV